MLGLHDLVKGMTREQIATIVDELSPAQQDALLASIGPSQVTQFPNPLRLGQYLDPATVATPALDLITDELVRAANTPDGRLIISMPPQEGKSVLASRRFPLWLLMRRPETRVALASYEQGMARRWGRVVRDDIEGHPELGLRVNPDVSSQSEWELLGDNPGGMYAVGVGSALTGRPVDVLIIDDPLKDRAQADSRIYRERAWDWWLDVGSTRLAPGAPVILIMTRWHEDDLAGRLLSAVDGHLWRVVNIPAQAESHNDPLGRAPGEFLTSARGRTTAQWEAIKVRSGSRTWASLYQGHPAPEEGAVFNPRWWRFWEDLPTGFDREITSWDCAFKGTDSSDFVVGQRWGVRGADRYLVDQVRGRWTFTETLEQMRRFCDGVHEHVVEDKANGTAVIDVLSREIPGMVGVSPTNSKEARAQSVTPEVESGNVWLPKVSPVRPWVDDLLTELQQFPSGQHDDQVDALTQALMRLRGPSEPPRVANVSRLIGSLPGW